MSYSPPLWVRRSPGCLVLSPTRHTPCRFVVFPAGLSIDLK
nr:MAG TPA: hypothetical protein [Caudoviricetes sp.]